MNNLIYDRTPADITRLKTLRTKIKNRTATEAEFAEWLTSMKGAYNNTDLNRVGEAINYLSGVLNEYGYTNNASARTDWEIGEKPNPVQMSDYLDNINKLKQAFPYTQIELPTDMSNLVIKDANDIERFFYDQIEIILGMVQTFVYSGVGGLGQNRVWQQRFRRGYSWASQNYRLEQYAEYDTVSLIASQEEGKVLDGTEKLNLAKITSFSNVADSIATINNSMVILDTISGKEA